MKRKRILKILAFIIALALIGFIISFANAFIGNPISKALAKRSVVKYVEENYGEWDYQVGKARYNFKFSEYYVDVTSPRSPDRSFTVETDSKGNIKYDSYDSYVTKGFNTWNRLEREMREEGERIFRGALTEKVEAAIFRYMDKQTDNYGEALILDMKLDLRNPPIPMEFYLYVFTEDVSWSKMAQIYLEAKEILAKENIPVASYSIRLLPSENETPEGNAVSWVGSLALDQFSSDQVIDENIDLAAVLEKYQKDYEDEINKYDKKNEIEKK